MLAKAGTPFGLDKAVGRSDASVTNRGGVTQSRARADAFVRDRTHVGKGRDWFDSSDSEDDANDSDCSTATPGEEQSEASDEAGLAAGFLARRLLPRQQVPQDAAVIMFDWDDTLIATTFLDKAQSSRQMTLALRTHARAVAALLRAARAVARVSVVTLSRRPWVLESGSRWLLGLDLPALFRELGVTVYYAGEHAEHTAGCRPDSVALKRNAMARCLTDWSTAWAGADPGRVRWNVLSVGDSPVERAALRCLLGPQACSQSFAHAPQCKTLKLPGGLALGQLTSELRRLADWLPRAMAHEEDLDLRIDQSSDCCADLG